MLVHFHGQAMATAQAPALENFPSVGGFHTGAKTMDAQATADFGLVCSLWHK